MSQGEVVGGVRGGPQSQTERAERVGRVKGLQAQGRAGMGRTGPLTRPSVQLQILVIRSFLVLHLLGILGVCEEGEAPLQLLKRTHPYLQGGYLRVCPTSPTPSTHTHTDTHQAWFSPRAAAPGTRSRIPDSHLWGQVRRRDSHTQRGTGHTEDARARGHPGRGRGSHKGGRGLETPTPGWHGSKDGVGGEREGARDGRPQEGIRRAAHTHSEMPRHSPHSQEHSRNLPPTPLEEKHGRPGHCYPDSPNADTQDFPRNQPETPAHRLPPTRDHAHRQPGVVKGGRPCDAHGRGKNLGNLTRTDQRKENCGRRGNRSQRVPQAGEQGHREQLGAAGQGGTCGEGDSTQGWVVSGASSAPLAPPPQPGLP